MGVFTINMPDVGEGVAEAELTEWSISVGDQVQEDDILAVVMTDKVAVEIPSSVSGKIVWLGGEPGDDIAIGARFVQIEIDGDVEGEVELVEEVSADIIADNPEAVFPDLLGDQLFSSNNVKAQEAGLKVSAIIINFEK